MKISKMHYILFSMVLVSSNSFAASTFHFNGGCDMVCSGDWGVGSTPGTVVCNGTVTSKSSQCPAKTVNPKDSHLRVKEKEEFAFDGSTPNAPPKKAN